MRILIAMLFALSMVACGKQEEQTATAKTNDPTMVNETDYSSCDIYGGAQSVEGKWYATSTTGPFRVNDYFTIGNGQLTWVRECLATGIELKAQVTVSAIYDAGMLQPLQAAADSKKLDSNIYHLTCDVAVSAVKVPVNFQGRCLVMTVNSNSLKLIRR